MRYESHEMSGDAFDIPIALQNSRDEISCFATSIINCHVQYGNRNDLLSRGH